MRLTRLMRLAVGVGVVMLAVGGGWATTATVGAQARTAAAQASQETQGADDIRREFRAILEQFPPALGVVLKSDPTLLTNPAYLTPYPALAKYLSDHPEIARNPTYFLEHVELVQWMDSRWGGRRTATPMTIDEQMRLEAISTWRETMSSFLFLLGFVAAASALVWIFRYIVEHRRWLRATRIQSEAHNKLLERFSSSAELAAYMESPAGAQFLASSPLSVESATRRAPGAPFSRILWSAQAGVVLIAAGVGFMLIQWRMVDRVDEVAQMLGAWGTFSIAVGVGFVISAAMSYVISSRMGLLGEPKA
ncbi:MAG TPA: hypothetical protein PKW63_12445 [Vicinamibacterales bacterium]|nr:hypothetical protein [Vicinamibacterales bacterium]